MEEHEQDLRRDKAIRSALGELVTRDPTEADKLRAKDAYEAL